MGFTSTTENAPTKVKLWFLLGLSLGRWNHFNGGGGAVFLTQTAASAFLNVMLHLTPHTLWPDCRLEGVADSSGLAA